MTALEPKRYKVIAEGGREHSAIREKRGNRRLNFFGEYQAGMYRDLQIKRADPNHNDPNNILELREKHAFEHEKDKMLRWFVEDELYREVCVGVLSSVSRHKPQVIEQLNNALHKDAVTALDLVLGISDERVPKEILADFFETWHEALREMESGLRAGFETVKEELIKKIPELISSGELSKDTDVSLVRDRLARVAMQAIDPLDADANNHFATLGAAVNGSDMVRISPISFEDDDPAQAFRHAMYHELVHVGIAGKKLTLEAPPGFTEGLNEQKSGLHFSHMTPRADSLLARRDFYVWLNEAITEKIARAFSGYNISRAYETEITTMKALIQSGVSRDALNDAYQENYRVGEQGVQRLPKFAALLSEIRRVQGPHWLLEQEEKFTSASCEK